jgi:hypothetical protein
MEKSLLRRSKGDRVSVGDKVFVRYEGKLTDGEIFDSNFSFSDFEAAPGRDLFSFVLGQNQVIEGWELGLNGTRLGQVIRLVIPPDQAYGPNERPGIPANSTLDFTVEIVGYSKADKSAPIAYGLEDVGVNLKSYGLTEKDLKRVSTAKIGLDIDDRLEGTDGIDFLTGLRGSNTISGGPSGDFLISAKGSDVFVYSSPSDSLPGKNSRDTIGGFGKDDKIDLSELSSGVAISFIGKDKFEGLPGEIQLIDGTLRIDLSGDRQSDLEIVLKGKAQVSANSFIF